jgi:hypothetical protein
MKLSEFLIAHPEVILQEWDAFAASMPHAGKALNQKELRDHAGQILRVIALDLQRPQSERNRKQNPKVRAGEVGLKPRPRHMPMSACCRVSISSP